MSAPGPGRTEFGARSGAGFRDESGFTLIEILVVVLILGVLMAIAIPTFLSLTGGARTNAAEADLTTAVQDEAAYLTTNGSFDAAATSASTAGFSVGLWTYDNSHAMLLADPGVNWTAAAFPGPGTAGTKAVAIDVISNATGAAAQVVLGTLGSDGNMYWVQDTGGTLLYLKTTALTAQPSSTLFLATSTSWKALATVTPGPPAATTTPTTANSVTTVTTAVASTSTSTSTTVASNGVTTTPSVNSSTNAYYGQEQLALVNSSSMTALSVTISVLSTPGVSYNGQYTTFWGGTVNSANSSDGSALHYTFTSSGSIVAGSWTLAAQFNGTGAARVTSGDTWTVTSTSQGVTSTQNGTF